jgi:nickel-dependent lactate racemase
MRVPDTGEEQGYTTDSRCMEGVTLPYGNKTAKVKIPFNRLMGVFRPKPSLISQSADRLILRALDRPIGTPRLSQLVRPGMKVVIIADDKTRPTPVGEILSLVVDQLHGRGIPEHDITVIFALGTHDPMTLKEIQQRGGPSLSRIEALNSQLEDPKGFVSLGRNPDGVEIGIDRRVAAADFRIGVGSVIPHPECGWGGGAKILYPGVASRETITSFHLGYALVDWNSYGSDSAPVRLNMERWVERVGLDFIINSVVAPQGHLCGVVAGHYVQAHRRAIVHARNTYSVRLPKKAHIVLMTSIWADENFWLASKAIFAGELAIRDGGTLILVTPCSGGVGPHPRYIDYVGRDDWKTLLREAYDGNAREPIAVSAAIALSKMRRRFDTFVVSNGLTQDQVEAMKYRYFSSVDEALTAALEKHGHMAQIAVFPDGIATLPEISAG